jgi:anti-sigma factor RsiW
VTIPCATVASYLAAHLDGEATPLGSDAIERHLAACDGCRAAADDFLAYRRAISRAYRTMPAPDALRRAVRHRVRERVRRRTRGWVAVAAALVFVTGVAVGLFTRREPHARDGYLGGVAAHLHDAYVEGGTPLDVSTSDPARLAAWFSGRVPFALSLPRVEQAGLRLVGGRVVNAGEDLAAFVAYRQGEAHVSVAVAAAREVAPRGAESEAFRTLRFYFSRQRGHNVISWTDGALSYALVSDLPAQGRASCTVCHGSGSGLRDVDAFQR